MSLIIGLTGGIVSGKSTVANMFKKLGAEIIDADIIGHNIITPHKPAWKKIIEIFGKNILKKDLFIDRKKLGYLVFNNKKLLKKLNEITHPDIEKAIIQKINNFKNSKHANTKVIIIDAPLIYETGIDRLMDKIILVNLKEKEQIKRLAQRNGFTKEESLKRIKSQIPNKEKAEKADYIINNNDSLENTRKQAIIIWQELMKIISKKRCKN